VVTVLYISPHLDDVALSCAGGLLERLRAGDRVVVCSVFTRTTRAAVDRRRAAEDTRALTGIGAEVVHLGFVDAPAREHVTPSFRSLVLDASVDAALVRDVAAGVRGVVDRLRPREVWLPVAIGGHVDHRTVFAARGAAGRSARFYEDRPYAFVPALRTLRRRELTGGRPRTIAAAAIERELVDGGCGAFVPPRARAAVTAELARRLAAKAAGEALVLRTRTHRHGAATLDQAAALIDAYASQIRWLFGATPVRELWSRLAGTSRGWVEREVVITKRSHRSR
jgi:LmbE family N-acetylglucosaminyl deacetylase